MWQSRGDTIAVGDLVILFETHKSVTYAYVKENEIFQNRFGAFHHNDMIGKPFGCKVPSRISKGFMYLLAPTPELWSKALKHRTQIIYTPDASAIIFNCHLKPGSRVIEAGTGSGSLSTSFARTVAPSGHLFTFEFNQHRAETASIEFERNGLKDFVTVEHRDVCERGFPSELMNKSIDAVFLDLPSPWKVIPYTKQVLKLNGSVCTYSPCIEQVQQTCDALREGGFQMIRTIETRLIPYEVRTVKARTIGDELSLLNRKKRQLVEQPTVPGRILTRREREIGGHTAFLTFALHF